MGVGGRLRERERLVLAEEVDFGGGEAELRVWDGGGELGGHVMRRLGRGAWWRGGLVWAVRSKIKRERGGQRGSCGLGGCVSGGLAWGVDGVFGRKSARWEMILMEETGNGVSWLIRGNGLEVGRDEVWGIERREAFGDGVGGRERDGAG